MTEPVQKVFVVNQTTTLYSGTVSISGTVAVTQSGTWDINNISGTISLPTGAATAAKQDTGNTSLSSIDGKLPTNGVMSGNSSTAALNAAATFTGIGTDYLIAIPQRVDFIPRILVSSANNLAVKFSYRFVKVYNQ